MANRSYLYASNVIPTKNAKTSNRKLMGISQWNYDIPIVYKILLCANPKICPSSIWKNQDGIAIVGDYAAGVQKLEAFLSKITIKSAEPLVTEALEFLKNPKNINEYFVLECGEIFEMEDTPLRKQNQALFAQIQNLQPEIEIALQSLQPPPPQPSAPLGFWAKLLGLEPKPIIPQHDPMASIDALGLGNWSNVLYYDFTHL